MKLNDSIILNTDSYKFSHALQYPEGTEQVFEYLESRGGDYPYTVFFGLQAFIKEYLAKPITFDDIMDAKDLVEAHGEPFNYKGWMHILTEHGGHLPLEIRAVPEGSVIPVKNALMTVVNTDPACFWLPSHVETPILRGTWYTSTVATVSHTCRRIINKYLVDTGDPGGLPFKLHDFGARGVSSRESAALGGMAHLATGAMGTDTVSALLAARKYYKANMAGFSIPAAEHSTMTILGREGELKQMERMVRLFAGPGKIYACVSDGYDIFNAVTNIWGGDLRDLVLNSGGTLVVRPDSGDPVTVCLRVVKLLDEKFGSTKNDKGFKVLNPAVRVIQGDGVNEHSIEAILMTLAGHGYSADNIAFGMGGALLQHMDRDTQKWAMKCSAAKINGKWVDVFKDPVTDQGKQSKKGQLALIKETDFGSDKQTYSTVATDSVPGGANLLRPVFRDGELLIDEDLETIRTRTISNLSK